jgi:hypothetical protein
MTSQYMFRHPDFIPLVNNFVNPEAPIHAPSATTKANGFNVLMVRLWVWTSHMIRQYASNEVENLEQQNETQKQLAELLSDVHDDLGEREICGADKGNIGCSFSTCTITLELLIYSTCRQIPRANLTYATT